MSDPTGARCARPGCGHLKREHMKQTGCLHTGWNDFDWPNVCDCLAFVPEETEEKKEASK